MDQLLFQAIAERIKNKNIARTALSLSKSYKPTVALKLETAKSLALSLYFEDEIDYALAVCELLGKEKFNGNYNLWTWIEITLILKCWINEQRQDYDSCAESLSSIIEIINLNKDKEGNSMGINASKNRLNGVLLRYDNIKTAIREKNKIAELNWRKLQFSELLYIYFLGGSDLITREKAIDEITENEQVIKEVLR